MIRERPNAGGVEWTCSTCDANGGVGAALPTRTWWAGKGPKICWRCVQREIGKTPTMTDVAVSLAKHFREGGLGELPVEEIRTVLEGSTLKVSQSWARTAAAVYRLLNNRRLSSGE